MCRCFKPYTFCTAKPSYTPFISLYGVNYGQNKLYLCVWFSRTLHILQKFVDIYFKCIILVKVLYIFGIYIPAINVYLHERVTDQSSNTYIFTANSVWSYFPFLLPISPFTSFSPFFSLKLPTKDS